MSATDDPDSLVISDDPLRPANLIPELCRNFYQLGWVTGTGGGITIRQGNLVYIAPSGVKKERVLPEHVFVLPSPHTDRVFLRRPTRKLSGSSHSFGLGTRSICATQVAASFISAIAVVNIRQDVLIFLRALKRPVRPNCCPYVDEVLGSDSLATRESQVSAMNLDSRPHLCRRNPRQHRRIRAKRVSSWTFV
uniref:Methylthioribulose-1-phosphate dehydratase n=1 Tax=Mycena chlorophos TaxID=658473 RepID=A0ABQ0KV16_MYCCL|nr:methylthioribulose-1-phosphate dehydratase [Mycena chlorophos]